MIPEWVSPQEQLCNLGRHTWSVARLIELARGLEPFEIPLKHLYVYYRYKNLTLREMAMHMKAVNEADLSFPIILDEDGDIMDGRHRVMKAMLEGKESIFAVRFDKNPSPCQVRED